MSEPVAIITVTNTSNSLRITIEICLQHNQTFLKYQIEPYVYFFRFHTFYASPMFVWSPVPT